MMLKKNQEINVLVNKYIVERVMVNLLVTLHFLSCVMTLLLAFSGSEKRVLWCLEFRIVRHLVKLVVFHGFSSRLSF